MNPGSGADWIEVGQRLARIPWRSVGVAAAAALVVAGGCLALRSEQRAAAVVLPRAGPAPSLTTATAGEGHRADGVAEIVVHAAGAVGRPGVYRMPASARVVDLLEAAGGPDPGADLSGINLAAALSDGVRVYFPRAGEVPPAEVDIVPLPPDPVAGGASDPGAAAAPGPLDLNTATAAELERLPGIGPVTAAAIVEHRRRVGPFRSVQALEDVSGIGPAKLGRIEHLVTVER